MTVRWERLRSGVVLAAVLAALAWATAWPAAMEAVGQKKRRTRQALPPPEEASAPAGERRVALVVGNGRYRELDELPNAVNDARAMAGALRELGFEVVGPAEGYVDLTREGLVEALRRFEGRLAEVERAGGALVVGLLYYAGHGMEVDGVNYLLPVDIRRGGDARYEGLELQKALDGMARYGVSIVILDACRDNPLRGQVAVRYRSSGELKPMEVGGGKMLMMYGASPGERAAEGEAEGNGLYTEVLLKHLGTPGLTAEQVFARVGEEVEQRSKGRQRPWMSGNLYGRFRFRPGGTVDGPVSSPGNAGAVEREAWETAKQSNNPEVVREFLREYPNGVYAKAARVLLAALEKGKADGGVGSGGTPASGGVGVSAGARPPAGARAGQVWASPAGIRLVWIPAGEYEMGSNNGESDEKPVHRVRLTQGYWLGETEVTQRQWEAVMGGNPSRFKDCPECPVESVSWEDCRRFVSELNARYPVGGGLVWRLPYEAEWEYACRGGTRSDYFGGDGEAVLGALGWYDKNSGGRTNPVKRLRANGWGLYDIHGNVWEWCEDWYKADYYRISPVDDPRGPGSGEYRVLRGGSWRAYAINCRAAIRSGFTPPARYYNLGLRVAVGAP